MTKVIKNAFSSEMSHIIHEIYEGNKDKIPRNINTKLNLNALINVFSGPDLVSDTYNKLLLRVLGIINIIL